MKLKVLNVNEMLDMCKAKAKHKNYVSSTCLLFQESKHEKCVSHNF